MRQLAMEQITVLPILVQFGLRSLREPRLSPVRSDQSQSLWADQACRLALMRKACPGQPSGQKSAVVIAGMAGASDVTATTMTMDLFGVRLSIPVCD